jgi:Bacteriophage clamp loader A subunit
LKVIQSLQLRLQMTPFDFLKAINQSKEDLIRNSDSPEVAERDYKPFIVNKGLSYFVDTILYANEMNSRAFLSNKLQNDYFLNSIRPGKRFSKWHKKEENQEIDCVKEYYQVSDKRAQEILKILSPEQLSLIKIRIIKGGNSDELRPRKTD